MTSWIDQFHDSGLPARCSLPVVHLYYAPPMKYAHMAKAIAGAVQAGLIAGAATLGTALADGQVTVTEWLILLAAVIGAAGGVGTVVYGVTNAPNPKAPLGPLGAPPTE